MGTRDVQVGEVGRIGFVEVVVAVVGGIVGLSDEWSEEVFRSDRGFLEVDLVDDAAQDAEL